MTINDLKLKESDFAGKQVTELSDRPSQDGMNATTLKEMFVAPSKRVIMPNFNALIDELVSQNGASGIGIIPIDGLSGYNIQNVLIAIKLLLDDKKSTEEVDRALAEKLDKSEVKNFVKEVTFSENTGVFTITKYDGSVKTYDTALEKITIDVRLDGQDFVLTLADGTEQRVDISKFLTETEVKSSDTITLSIENGAIVARIVSGSINLSHLNAEVTAFLEGKEQAVINSANAAKVSEQNALNSANAAETARQAALECQRQACNCAGNARTSETNAANSEANALDSANKAGSAATRAEKAALDAEKIVVGDSRLVYVTGDDGYLYKIGIDAKGMYYLPVDEAEIPDETTTATILGNAVLGETVLG